jgi:hypothetical protein
VAGWRYGGFYPGVCCTLFGSFDTPAPHIVKYIIGSFWGVVISLFYSFALLPQVSDFPVLVAVLAPAYLLAGSLQARPPTTFMAMGITLTLPILCELGRTTAETSPLRPTPPLRSLPRPALPSSA